MHPENHPLSRWAQRRHFLSLVGGLAVATLPLSQRVHAQDKPAAPAAGASGPYEPKRGQAGKDVIWIPTPDAVVQRMLRLAQVTEQDFVIDLGSGDGKIVLAAAREGAKAHGVEYNPEMVALSQKLARDAGLQERASFEKADIFEMDFSRASVITMYLLPELNLRLRPRIMALKPGTRVVSHSFRMGEWVPDEESIIGAANVCLWIVPANVGGKWHLKLPGQGAQPGAQPGAQLGAAVGLTIAQTFQQFVGDAKFDDTTTSLRQMQLRGDLVSFAFTDARGVLRQFNGKVTGDRIEGTVTTGNGAQTQPFTAQRVGAAPAIKGSGVVAKADMEYLVRE